MMRISTFKTALRLRLLGILCCLPFFAQSQVVLSVATSQVNDIVTAKFHVNNFTDILSMQFTVDWDVAEMAFLGTHSYNLDLGSLTVANFGTTQTGAGKVILSWFDPNTNGVTLPPCSSLFSIDFQLTGSTIPPISITGSPTSIEVVDNTGNQLLLLQNTACSNIGQITGNVFYDMDGNCLPGPSDIQLKGWKIKVENGGNTFYCTSNSLGEYSFYALPGQYEVSVLLPGTGLWTACQPQQTVQVTEDQQIVVDFAIQALIVCPQMNVDISAPFLRRCFNSKYYVKYCNEGTVTAENAFVEITFDPFLEVTGSSIPWSGANGQTYTFDLGDVAVGQCGSFTVDLLVSCDAVLGQAHCSSAHIYPDDICIPVNPLWDGSDLEVTGLCDGDSVRFNILNKGEDMAFPVEFIVIEDDMIQLTSDPFLLNHLQAVGVAFPSNGATWRLEVGQAEYTPFNSAPNASVEGCGTNGSGSFSLGFVTQFPQGDGSPFFDRDCMENIGAYDPNDKTGYPKGFCASRFVKADQDIEYLVRFQNTGTDTAFNIVIQDTISASFDPASVVPGVASHPYEFELSGNGIVRFTFDNIMLPDSNVNEAASHGFVKFKISQKTGNPVGTLLENSAAIYFDFNEPIITNNYQHMVGDLFIEMTGSNGDLSVSGFVATWYGEPVEHVEMLLTNVCSEFTGVDGYFLFAGLDTATYSLAATKPVADPMKGVTVLDLVKLRQYILSLGGSFSAYQSLAADLNGSQSISTFDFVVLTNMIVGVPPPYSNPLMWKFVVADTALANPLPQTVTAAIQYSPLDMSMDHQNFTAIKPGNVITEDMVEISPLLPEFYFVPIGYDDQTWTVEVRANRFEQVVGLQFGLQWDGAILELEDIGPAGSPALFNLTENAPAPGQLWLLAMNKSGPNLTLPDSSTLFTLTFQVLGQAGSSTELALDDSIMPFQVVVEDCKLAVGSIQSTTFTVEDPTAVSTLEMEDFIMKIAPNPVKSGQPTVIETTSASAKGLAFQIFDTTGARRWVGDQNIPAGRSRFTISPPLPCGLYLLNVSDKNGLERTIKLVVGDW